MNPKIYESLIKKLDTHITRLKFSHPVVSPPEFPHSVGLINEKTDITKIPEKEIPLVHTMLHMFSANKSGDGLSQKTIEKLHKEVVKRLKSHIPYDRLDKK